MNIYRYRPIIINHIVMYIQVVTMASWLCRVGFMLCSMLHQYGSIWFKTCSLFMGSRWLQCGPDCMYVNIHIYIRYIYIHIHMYIHIFVYVYIYTHRPICSRPPAAQLTCIVDYLLATARPTAHLYCSVTANSDTRVAFFVVLVIPSALSAAMLLPQPNSQLVDMRPYMVNLFLNAGW